MTNHTTPMTDEEVEDFDFELAAQAEQAAERHLESRYEDGSNRDWQSRLSEANDAIGAARDALRNAKNWSEQKVAEKDLTFWLQQKAHVEGWMRAAVVNRAKERNQAAREGRIADKHGVIGGR